MRNYERKHAPGWRAGRAADAVRLHGEGWSARQIARRLDVSDSTTRRDLRDSGAAAAEPHVTQLRQRRGWHAEAEMLRASGHPDHRTSQRMPYTMIAERLGVDEAAVRRHFAREARREARAAEARRLRAAGLSLRQIAARLRVDEATVRRDLSIATVRHLPARSSPPDPLTGAGIAHPDAASVTPLRRTS